MKKPKDYLSIWEEDGSSVENENLAGERSGGKARQGLQVKVKNLRSFQAKDMNSLR